MKNLLIIVILIVPFLNCTTSDVDEEINLQISNKSDFTLENIVFISQGNELRFDSLKSGESSQFKKITSASNVFYVRLTINGVVYERLPIDVFEETQLESGEHNFVILVNIEEETIEVGPKENFLILWEEEC